MKKYLIKKGWIRHKKYEEKDWKVFFFEHPKYGQYQIHYSKDSYLLSDDSDELYTNDVKLTKSIMKQLIKHYVNTGYKTY